MPPKTPLHYCTALLALAISIQTAWTDPLRPHGLIGATGVLIGDSTPASVDRMKAIAPGQPPPKGVLLEGTAELGPIESARYDPYFNALVINEREVYYLDIPRSTVEPLWLAVCLDPQARVGVSAENKLWVYGSPASKPAYQNSQLARELMVADLLLGDIVFNSNHLARGYVYPSGGPPRSPIKEVSLPLAVTFRFWKLQFAVVNHEIIPLGGQLSAYVYPVSKIITAAGNTQVNFSALAKGLVPREYTENALFLTKHADYFAREPIVRRVLAYAETAAVMRRIKASGQKIVGLVDTKKAASP